MRVVEGLPPGADLAVALGPFDSLHAGQRARLDALVEAARERALAPAVVQTAESSAPAVWPGRALEERLAATGVEQVFRAPDVGVAALEAFVAARARLLVLPASRDPDIHAHARRLASALLEATLLEVPTTLVDGAPASTRRVADSLAAADFALARRLLTEPYVLSGVVVRGDELGRQLGVPTANVELGPEPPCLRGVYAAEARIGGATHHAMAYVGMRPSLGGSVPMLEVHLIGIEADLYGETIAVQFLAKVADEVTLPSIEALGRRVRENLARVVAYFGGAAT